MTAATPSIEQITAFAARLLSKRFGGRQRLEPVAELGGMGSALVIRAKLAPSAFLQERTVVVKYVPVTDDELDDAAMVREVVAYQFTTSLGEEVRPGPVLLAYDCDHRILVITDVGDGATLVDLLERADSEQRVTLLADLGQSLGRMHAATVGRENDFETLRLRMARRHPDAAAVNVVRTAAHGFGIQRGLELLAEGGAPAPSAVVDVADEAVRMMRSGTRAFTPFDLSPDNIIVAERTRLLDYEWAGFRDWTIDVASVVAGFPQFVSTRPFSDAEADVFIEAWAREVSGGQAVEPLVAERFHVRLATALLGIAVSSVCAMHYGAPHNVVAAAAEAAGTADFRTYEDIITPVQALLGGSLPEGANEEQRNGLWSMRRDLFESFEALARYARRTSEPRFTTVAEYASDVVELLAKPMSGY